METVSLVDYPTRFSQELLGIVRMTKAPTTDGSAIAEAVRKLMAEREAMEEDLIATVFVDPGAIVYLQTSSGRYVEPTRGHKGSGRRAWLERKFLETAVLEPVQVSGVSDVIVSTIYPGADLGLQAGEFYMRLTREVGERRDYYLPLTAVADFTAQAA
jgi:hypothetical protein